MSGIVGIYRRDGGAIDQAGTDRNILERLTEFLAYRGPDGSNSWSSGSIGFGHTMLRTGHQAAEEKQPYILPPGSSSPPNEAQLAIVADARIDCRASLRAELAAAGHALAPDATDPELILAAYCAWGEDCVQHLRGDFAFAIWDASVSKVFCARDHFGVKPFYYADLPSVFLFSNTLQCLLLHPGVSSELNELALADFLLFGMNYDVSTTPFRDLRRLPAAHTLTVSPEGVTVRGYWQPPTSESIRYRDEREYVAHFNEILRDAVRDRVQAGRVGILLSGGLDSGSVAATVRELMRESATPREARAFTITYESLLQDREGEFARKTAAFLGIPTCTIEIDEQGIFNRDERAEILPPEPTLNSLLNGTFRHFQSMATWGRVALCGEGNDNLMDFQMWPYVRHLAKSREWRELAKQGAKFLKGRQIPWRGIRTRAGRWLGIKTEPTQFPEWISPDLDRRLNLRRRWASGQPLPQVPTHSLTPRGYASLFLPHWANIFEGEDPGATGFNVEVRYPYLDLRMVHFLLALPPYPWFFKKALVRTAMIGKLPEDIRARPKMPLQGDPIGASLARQEFSFQSVVWDPDLSTFADVYGISRPENRVLMTQSADRLYMTLRPLCLNFWLQSLRSFRYKVVSGRI